MKNMYLALLIMVGGILSCSPSATKEIDLGTMADGLYQNEYFGFKVDIPSEWTVQDQYATNQLVESGEKMISGDDAMVKMSLKLAEKRTVYLFMVFEHPVGSAVEMNPSIVCVAERVREFPGIKTGDDYLFHMKKLLAKSPAPLKFNKAAEEVTLGGVKFHRLDGTITAMGQTVNQKYYATVMKGYALSFVTSGADDAQQEALNEIITSLRFDIGSIE